MSEMTVERHELSDALRQVHAALGARPSRDPAWRAISDAGWLGLTVDEAQGGLEQSLSAACWLHMELGRALSPAPVLPALLAVEALRACEPSPDRDGWLERIVGGDAPAVSLLDPDGADLRINGEAINGNVSGVEAARQGGHILIVVTGAKLLALVPLSHPGVKVVSHPGWDLTRALSDIVLTDVPLADALVLARGDGAEAAIRALSVHLHFGIAADCVGAADALLDRTVDHLKERRQFDRPLAMFQALQHRCADLKVAIASAEALLLGYLKELEAGTDRDPVTMAKAAKSIASTTFRMVAEESLQLHGGMGMTSEHVCHLFLKRALLNEHLASADDACDLAVGRELMATARR